MAVSLVCGFTRYGGDSVFELVNVIAQKLHYTLREKLFSIARTPPVIHKILLIEHADDAVSYVPHGHISSFVK